MADLKCPKCGGGLFLRKLNVRGPWRELVDETGATIDTDLTGVRAAIQPKTMRCAESQCEGRVPNPHINESASPSPSATDVSQYSKTDRAPYEDGYRG